MRSGQLARLTGLSTDSLRHYERLELLAAPARTAGNYRVYAPSSQQRVELIQRAMKMGFSLSELKAILAVRDKGGAPCKHVRQLLGSKIRRVNQQIKDLLSMRLQLRRIKKDWDRRLRRTKAGQAARLLENVPRRLNILTGSSVLKPGKRKRR